MLSLNIHISQRISFSKIRSSLACGGVKNFSKMCVLRTTRRRHPCRNVATQIVDRLFNLQKFFDCDHKLFVLRPQSKILWARFRCLINMGINRWGACGHVNGVQLAFFHIRSGHRFPIKLIEIQFRMVSGVGESVIFLRGLFLFYCRIRIIHIGFRVVQASLNAKPIKIFMGRSVCVSRTPLFV